MLGEMRGDIKSLHEKVDTVVAQVKQTNGRVNELEDWKSNIMGKITVILVVGGAAWAFVAAWISKKLLL